MITTDYGRDKLSYTPFVFDFPYVLVITLSQFLLYT